MLFSCLFSTLREVLVLSSLVLYYPGLEFVKNKMPVLSIRHASQILSSMLRLFVASCQVCAPCQLCEFTLRPMKTKKHSRCML